MGVKDQTATANGANPRTGRTQNTPQAKRKAVVIDLTGDDDDDDDEDFAMETSAKRHKPMPKQAPMRNTVTPKRRSPNKASKAATPRSSQPGKNVATPERRLRRWRSHAPVAYQERRVRALSQRMFVLDRTRGNSLDGPYEELVMSGSTGNLYTVTIGTLPHCTCPDSGNGHMCKHIIYALVRVLKAPSELQYQLSLLPSELEEIFAAAPLPTEEITEAAADTEHPDNRKPIEGDCPICFCDLADEDPKDVVWCKAACGNNIHRTCFAQWAATSKRTTGGKVRCVYCRADWEAESGGGAAAAASYGFTEDGKWKGGKEGLAALRANAFVGEDGYMNIAHELGQDSERDMSTYHQPWVRSNYYGRRNDYSRNSSGWGL